MCLTRSHIHQLASVPLDFIDAAPESQYNNAQSQPPPPQVQSQPQFDDNDYGDDAGHNEDDDLDDQPRDFDADGNIVASPHADPVGESGVCVYVFVCGLLTF